MKIDTTFPHSYECLLLDEMPGYSSVPHYYYPGAKTEGGKDGILLSVRPEGGEKWLGTFAFGILGPSGPNGIFTTPDPKRLCVIAKGEGYFVSADDPTAWESVPGVPIREVCSDPVHKVMIFADFTGLVAFGPSGLKWKSKRVSWDGIQNLRIENGILRGDAASPFDNHQHPFTVDLESGAVEGGSYNGPD